MHAKTLTKSNIPAKATAINLANLFVIGNFVFQTFAFILNAVTTFINFGINLGLFFLGAAL